MFERITIRNSTEFGTYDGVELGSLAEAILLYGAVDLLIHRGNLRKLLTVCGPHVTLRLLEGGYVVPRYLHWNGGVYTENAGTPQETHLPTTFTVGTSPEDDIRAIFEQVVGRSSSTRRLVRRFMSLAPRMDSPDTLPTDTLSDLADESSTEASVRTLIAGWAPACRLPSGFYFRVEQLPENRIRVATNLDLAALSTAYMSHGQGASVEITLGLILSELVDARLDMTLCATLQTDMLASDVSSTLFQIRAGRALRSQATQREISTFSEMAFGGKDIRGAINSGARSIEEFLPILDRSAGFRDWIRDKPAEVSLARAYFEESTRGSWVDTLPARALRWSLISLAAVAMPATAAASLGATDSLLLSRLLRGWRPNHFIDRQVRPFVRGT